MAMSRPPKPTTSLFDVYLRLRPSFAPAAERFLDVEEADDDRPPTHITIRPPESANNRKKAVEKFVFTRVFEEDAAQLDLYHGTGLASMVQGVLGPEGREGRDGLLATLGVSGSGKSHTILGSRSQRGLTQLSLDVLYQSLDEQLAQVSHDATLMQSLTTADAAESQLFPANAFLQSVYGDGEGRSQSRGPRATTPMMDVSFTSLPRPSTANSNYAFNSNTRRHLPRISNMPQHPTVEDIALDVDPTAEFAIVVSMYEVYNDRIFDLLTCSATKNPNARRRPLLYKSTEASPDRKVVAGLKKVVCGNLDEAMLVLETGLTERKVAGTGANAVSSRSHGFFCVEVKKRHRGAVPGQWTSSALTIVDLAGSERARTARTQGQTLAEAGKINESLMYLGQCMQLQSDNAVDSSGRPQNIVPFRQCKLTELLFSNSFPSTNSTRGADSSAHRKRPQKAIMVVTADPLGDFNATSQILRYSALAREVTVPRVPSVTSTIVNNTAAPLSRSTTAMSSRSTSSNTVHQMEAELTRAFDQISQLREELEMTQFRLDEEIVRRRQAESSWKVAEEKIEMVEAEVRDEVWAEMEQRMEIEMHRWRAARDAEKENDNDYLDRKLEILAQGLQDEKDDGQNVKVWEDDEPSLLEKVEDLEDENQRLKEKIAQMEREKTGMRSPSKKMRVLKARKWEGSGIGLDGSP